MGGKLACMCPLAGIGSARRSYTLSKKGIAARGHLDRHRHLGGVVGALPTAATEPNIGCDCRCRPGGQGRAGRKLLADWRLGDGGLSETGVAFVASWRCAVVGQTALGPDGNVTPGGMSRKLDRLQFREWDSGVLVCFASEVPHGHLVGHAGRDERLTQPSKATRSPISCAN
jgi:hypothetical protein